jgi:endonuclease/exonuclease/phosphatase family metal-dependent hydrolase
VTWLAALILMTLAIPVLLARLAGGYPPRPGPELAALAPLAVVPAVAAVIIAAHAAWWLAALLVIPAGLLVRWQLPPLRGARFLAAPGPLSGTGSAATTLRLRLFTLNARGGAADPAAILRIVRQHDVDVLAVQELTPPMVTRLAAAGLTRAFPFSHLDPRPGGRGAGLWARWPLTPLPPVPGLAWAAPRARLDPPGGLPVTLTAVHPVSPVQGRRAGRWRRELAMIQQALAAVDEPQVVAGDFNATRDHRPFRELLAAGFADCADSSQNRSWPGFTWPSLPVMRLDHVLVSRTATVPMARTIRVPRTDHHGVLADIEFTRET